jgi:mono/diheme cytochrome c family protein
LQAAQSMPFPIASMKVSIGLAAAIAVGLALAGSVGARRLPAIAAALMLLLGLGWFGAFETLRESIRKPYILAGYVYGNGSLVSRVAESQRYGLLAGAKYSTGNDGADLFRQACRNCHTWTGYKPLKPAFDGVDRSFIAAIAKSTHLLRGNMPPFPGTSAEAEKLADYLYSRTDRRRLSETQAGPLLGRKAFEMRCGVCHPVGSPNDKSKSFAGLGSEEVGGLLDMGADLGEGMPAYTGDAKERAALVVYLQELGRKVKP